MKKSKYNSIKTGGYDSRKEAKRAGELKLLERAGEISNLREQVKFELVPVQHMIIKTTSKMGRICMKEVCVERACNYFADFVYVKDGETVVEDVKGMRTEVYRIKKKLMLFIHSIKIKEL